MNHEKTFVYALTFFITLFSSVSVYAKTSSRLLSIDNLGDRSNVDNGYLISSLSAQVKESKKKVKSIAVYRQNLISNEMTLQDSILFNKKGLPVLRLTPYSKNYNKTFYFYDQKGRPYLNVYVVLDSDTLYTLNQYNRTDLEIQYKVREKIIEYLIEKEVIPISDSIVQLKKMQYQQEWKLKKNVPTKSLDMWIQQTNDSLVSVETKAIRYEDSLNSSTYKSKLRIKNNALISEDMNDQFKYDADGFWIERENKFLKMKRLITYYEPKEEEKKLIFLQIKRFLNIFIHR